MPSIIDVFQEFLTSVASFRFPEMASEYAITWLFLNTPDARYLTSALLSIVLTFAVERGVTSLLVTASDSPLSFLALMVNE